MKKIFNYIFILIIGILIGSLVTRKLLIEDKFSYNENSVVYIESNIGDKTYSSGSGIVYKTDEEYAYILTNYHVIENSTQINVYNSAKKMEIAKLYSYDDNYDIAVLKVENKINLKKVKLGNSDNINVGDEIYVLGTPITIDYIETLTKGIISNLDRKININNALISAIQIDATVLEGNSGSALFNKKGEVIGLVFMKENTCDNIGFAIPINEILNRVDNNINSRPNLGATFVNSTNVELLNYYNIEVETLGVVLVEIKEGSLSLAGLDVGDVITKFDEITITNIDDLKEILYKHKKGDKISIEFYQKNEYHQKYIEL